MSRAADLEATVQGYPSTIPISQPDSTLAAGWVGTSSLPASGAIPGTYPADGAHVPQVTLTAAGTVSTESDLLIGIAGNQVTSGSIPAARIQEVIALADLTDVIAKTGTGTVVVMQTSPALVTPDLGTPSAGVGTNLTALNATQLTTGTLPDARLSNTGVPAGTYNDIDLSVVTAITLDAKGRVTSVLDKAITPSKLAGMGAGVATWMSTPSSANLAAALTDETGTGANVFATSPTLVTPLLGTPTSGTLTNCTGLPVSSGISGLGTGVATALATPSSANIAAACTDETGSGSLVFATSPTLVTPALGTPASGNATNMSHTGKIVTVTRLTSGTGATFTPNAATTAMFVRLWGPGGGGGGAAATAANAAAGGGGGSGGYAEKFYSSIGASYTYSITTGGAGGTAGANDGTTPSGPTTFDNAGSMVSANQGSGGKGATAGVIVAVFAPGAGAPVSTGGDTNGGGAPGMPGIVCSGTAAINGMGGSTSIGGGGGPRTTEAAGIAGNGFGSGGSGGVCLGTTARAGGAGKDGLIIVTEYA